MMKVRDRIIEPRDQVRGRTGIQQRVPAPPACRLQDLFDHLARVLEVGNHQI